MLNASKKILSTKGKVNNIIHGGCDVGTFIPTCKPATWNCCNHIYNHNNTWGHSSFGDGNIIE